MDLNKLSEKVAITIIISLSILVATFFTLSYTRNEPFSVYGKEFGFGTGELSKKVDEIQQLRKLLTAAQTENQQLKRANSAFTAEQQERARQMGATWFHVESIEFNSQSDTFTTGQGKQGTGIWVDKESELRLKLLEKHDRELVLGTNLAAPANKISIPYQQSMFIPMPKYDYRVTVISIYGDSAEVRVERRSKQPRA